MISQTEDQWAAFETAKPAEGLQAMQDANLALEKFARIPRPRLTDIAVFSEAMEVFAKAADRLGEGVRAPDGPAGRRRAVTQLEVIRMIGDMLTEIDIAVGSMLPGDPDMTRLQDLRRLLDSRQLMLSRQVFDDNTPRFRAAAAELEAVNLQISGQIERIDNMVSTIQKVTKFLDAVTSFLGKINGLG